MTTIVLILMTAAFGPPGDSSRPTRVEVLEQALRDYEQAIAAGGGTNPETRRLLERARGGFEELTAGGIRNGRLYFNIANTEMQLGNLGRAVLNYRRAQRLMPGDAAIRHNLEAARKLRRVSFSTPATSAIRETLLYWHYNTSALTRLRVAMFGYAAFWVVLLAGLKFGRRPWLVWTAVVLGATAGAAGASVAYEQAVAQHGQEGVITSAEVVLRKGNGEYYDPALVQPLPEGVEFSVRATREDVKGATWFQVELPDGKTGWLPASTAVLIGNGQ